MPIRYILAAVSLLAALLLEGYRPFFLLLAGLVLLLGRPKTCPRA
ncbi:hypothetical protein [Thermus tenuipuniceus]|nr:hypothetical protein [Thermus tenuipuniceus]